MNSIFLTVQLPLWGDILVILLALYLFFVFLKQAYKSEGEFKAICMITAIVVIPLLLLVHFLGQWDFSEEAEFNRLGNWWVAPLEDIERTADGVEIIHKKPFNMITAGLIVCGLYIGATVLVWILSAYHLMRRRSRILTLRRVLFKLAVLLIGLIVYMKYLGIDLTPLWLGMGAASIVLGIALQEPLSSLFKGVALDMEGVIHRGEWIRVGGPSGLAGKVVDKNWRTTKIMTIDDELVTIPNSVLGSEQILNYNQPQAAHVHRLNVGTSYNDPPVKVKEVLRSILIRQPLIEKYPPPVIRTINYNDFSIDYQLKFWLRDYGKNPGVRDAIMTQIWYAFKFYGIEIPFPIRTVHLKEREHLAEEEQVIDQAVGDIKGFLMTLPYFQPHLKYKDFDFLALNAFQRRYLYGEHVIHKGELGDALYIVREGWCEVILPSGERRKINPGDYFGEMGLITLQPRTADVVAGEDSATAIRLDRECMQILFKRYPDLMNEFERVRETRMEDAGLQEKELVPVKVPLATKIGRAVLDFLRPW
ncbi:MAG: cyclic nucleotide-binding domain-containing protein [Planctomycetota bacterium]|jgi:small-conductance mechanosensitive channel